MSNDFKSIEKGDFYEDAFFHPCICLKVDKENDRILGISLIDGSFPRSCSLLYSGIRKLTLENVVQWKFLGPDDSKFSAPWINKKIKNTEDELRVLGVLE